MRPIDLADLDAVIGGSGMCTPDDPEGTAGQAVMTAAPFPTDQQQSDYREGITPQARSVIDATDRAMAPWKLFNGLLGGFRAPSLGYKP